MRCYKCERKWHKATDCKAKTKANGEPCNPRPRRRETVNAVGSEEGGERSEDKKEDTPSAALVRMVRPAGSTVINTIHVNNVNQSMSSLIVHPVLCNGVKLDALVDTGAAVSIINSATAAKNKWKIKPTRVQLVHAAGETLDCVGQLEAELELSINQKTLKVRYEFLIVNNLCAPILIGLELMRIMKIIINPLNEAPLSFQKGVFQKGIRLSEEKIVPARHMMLVDAQVATTAELVATIQSNFGKSIMVANTLSPVVNSKIKVLSINIDTWDVRIKRNQQIGSYHCVIDQTGSNPTVWGIHNVLPLADSGSHINVGDGPHVAANKFLGESDRQ